MKPAPELDQPHPGFADPETFGEDLGHNVERVKILAPVHCGGCGGYHLERVLRRLKGSAPSLTVDRRALMAMIGHLLVTHPGRGSGKAAVIIAGAADTGLLAASAHAAWLAGIDCRRQVEFLVLDRCPSPLILCTEYAARHGLAVRTRVTDFAEDEAGFAGDLVVVHSLLRFIPKNRHVELLRRLGGWLRPGGHILFSNTIVPAEERWRYTPHPEELPDVAGTLELIRQAGLTIVRQQEIRTGGPEVAAPRHRLIALLANQ